jgi:chromosome partitioning protein
MYDIRTKMAREILSELRSHFGDKMFKTVVNFNTKLKEAASFGQPIGEYDPASKGHNDFQALVKELLQTQPGNNRRQIIETLSEKLEAISATAEQLLEKTKSAPARKPQISQPDAGRIKTIETTKQKTPKAEPVAVLAEPPVANPPVTRAVERIESKPAVPPLRPASKDAEAGKQAEAKKSNPTATDAKLSDYYGVNQVNDAVAFVTLYPRAKTVQIAGDFNDWQPSKLQLDKVGETGVWQAAVKLAPGKYRYRLVVDGQWQQDPYNESTELNPFGGYNSIVEVK